MPRKQRPRRPGALTDLQPLRILTQIVILQVAYYVSAAVLIIFTVLVAGKQLSLDLLLSWHSLRGDTTVGWMLGLVWMLNSLFSVVGLLVLVARSKLVPDFVLTIHFLHLIVTSLYSHAIPRNGFWWMLQAASAGLMTSLGIWACRWRELRPISFGGRPVLPATTPSADGSEAAGNEGEGYARGRGRGRGRDGSGGYEMVGLAEDGDGDGNV